MSESIFWVSTWAIVGCTIIGIILSTKSCTQEQRILYHQTLKHAVDNQCIFIEGNRDILICDRGK